MPNRADARPRRFSPLLLVLLTGCRLCGGDDPYVPPLDPIDAGPAPDGASDASSDAASDTPPLPAPAETLESWPFDYAPTEDRVLLFSNFPEALTVDNLAESPTPVAFFRHVVRAGERYRLVFDHFNRTLNGASTLEAEGLPARCNEPTDLAIYLQVQAVAETPEGSRSLVTIVRNVTEVVKVERSQEPFQRFFEDEDVGRTSEEIEHPALFEHRLVEQVRAGELFVGAIDFNVAGDAPGYVVSLVASRRNEARPGLAGLQYHGFAHTECMKPSDWRRQYLGELTSTTVRARVPLLLRCDDTTADDNTIFHGEGDHEPITQNAPGSATFGADGRPLLWGTHAHYELGGAARPTTWPDHGYVNLYDLMDVRTYRATPPELEPEYLAPLPEGIRPADPRDRLLVHRMYERGRPTTADPTSGRDRTWEDNLARFPNWPNFGVVYRHELEVRNECHLPRRIHVHLHRPALVTAEGGGNTGVWDRPMPCNVATSNGLVLRRDDGVWEDARLGACRSDNVSRDSETEYSPEERGGILRIVTLDIPANGTTSYAYDYMLTPPSTQNLVHVVTLDPIRRVAVPACFASYVYRPFEGRHTWRNWSGSIAGGEAFDYVIDSVDFPGQLSSDGAAIAFTPSMPGQTAVITYRYHDEGETPLHEKCDASCPEGGPSACPPGGAGDACRTGCARELELCGPDARCMNGDCRDAAGLHAARVDPLSAVAEGVGQIEIRVADCPPGTTWNASARECQSAPPALVGSACPASGTQVDWAALRAQAMSTHEPSRLLLAAEIPYNPGPDFPGYESGPCGQIAYRLPVPCDGYVDYTAWRLGGSIAVFRVRDGLPGTAGFNRWVHNPGYVADGMMDASYTHPAKTIDFVDCSGGGTFGGCSFGTYGEDRSSLVICDRARMDASAGPLQPGVGAYGGRIRAFPVYGPTNPHPILGGEPDASFPDGYRECFDVIHLAAQGGGIALACQPSDGLEHGTVFIGFQAVESRCE